MNAIAPIFAAAVALSATLDRKSFDSAMKVAKRVTEKRNTIPILSHVLIDLDRDRATVTATDLDMTATTELPAATEGTGRFTVDCYGLAAALAKFKGEHVKLTSLGNGKAELLCPTSGARVTLASYDAETFPHLPTLTAEPVRFYMPELQLRDAWAAVGHAISTEETRYYLNGIFVHGRCERPADATPEQVELEARISAIRDAAERDRQRAYDTQSGDTASEAELAAIAAAGIARWTNDSEIRARRLALEEARRVADTMTFAATDGHRLAKVDLPIPEGATGIADSIIPRKLVKVALAVIGRKGTGYTDVGVTLGGRIALQLGRVRLESKLIDGTFPDYTRVIPARGEKVMTVDPVALGTALDSVTATMNERTRAVGLSVANGDTLVLSTYDAENGRAAVTLPATIAGGDDFAIGFNAKYLADAMTQCAGGDVTVYLYDAAAPTRIESEANPALTIVLMPMRLDASVLTVAEAAAINSTAMERFTANMAGDGLDAETFGKLKSEAVAFAVSNGTAKPAARAMVAGLVAIATGDDAGHDRAKLMLEAAYGGDLRSVAAIDARDAERRLANDPMEIVRRSHEAAAGRDVAVEAAATLSTAALVEAASEAVVLGDSDLEEAAEGDICNGCGRDSIDCSRDPCIDVQMDRDEALADAPEAEPVQPEPTPVAEPESIAPVTPETDEADAEPVKIADVYGRVYFVDAGDYADESKVLVRRLHKGGAPFTARESEGGHWIKIHRDNIERRIFPRGTVDAPAKPIQPVKALVDPLADRLAALEATVAALGAGQPAAVLVEPVGRAERTPAHVRAIRAYLALRKARAALATVTAERDDARTFRRDLLAQRQKRVLRSLYYRGKASDMAARLEAEHDLVDRYTGKVRELGTSLSLSEAAYQEARDRAALLQVRCDALERLSVDSAALDVRPAAPVPTIIMPIETAGARR